MFSDKQFLEAEGVRMHIKPDGTFTVESEVGEPALASLREPYHFKPHHAVIYDANPPPRWKFWKRRMKPVYIEFEE